MTNYCKALEEAGIEVNRADFVFLPEAAQVKVTDDVLTGMMKFITDKYNSIDFGEIEKSAGDIRRFKYQGMIMENLMTLRNIYESSPDDGAAKYVDVVNATISVMNFLDANRSTMSVLYKSGNGIVQLTYTSLDAACIYTVGTLVSNTIRFVTTEQNTDCEVLFDEIPGTIKHVHIKNIMAASNDLETFAKMLDMFSSPSNRKTMSESVTVTGVMAVVLGTAGVIMLVPRIIMMIREIIYSVYYSRVKVADMLELQADLIRTNIESLEAGRGNRKVIARQKKIADKLEKWKNRIALKMDTTETLKRAQQKKENASLKIDRNSPMMSMDDSTDGILL